MAVPKRKTPRSRQGQRRSHSAIKTPAIDYCPQCHSPKLAHRACPTCGTYLGRQVFQVKAKKGT